MERNRRLSWIQTHEEVERVMEGFRSSEGSQAASDVSLHADAPEPVHFKRKGGIYSIRYSWKAHDPSLIQVESMEFSDQNLHYLHAISARDGTDSVAFTHSGLTYIARRTTLKMAKRLFAFADRLVECVFRVVGYLRTLSGSIYILSRVEKATWSFDPALCAPHLQAASWQDFSSEHKERFAELATEMIVKLHRSGHILSNPVPSGVMLDSKKAFVADPRDIRPARRPCDVVDNFILMLRGLTRRGLDSSGAVFYCLSVYVNSMEKECLAWYGRGRKYRHSGADLFQVACELESRVMA